MDITIAAAQYPITKHKSFDDWRSHVEQWVMEAFGKGASLLLFPEYGCLEMVSFFPEEKTRGNAQQLIRNVSSYESSFCSVFADLAKKYQLVIVAPSFPVVEGEKIHNRAFVFSPKGLVGYQDKFFMTRFEGGEWGVSSAPKVLTLFEAPWGNFGIQICYDVEFALGSNLLFSAGACVMLAPSCTETERGASRVHIGSRARALEAQAFSVVSQTVGEAPWSRLVGVNYGYTAFYCAPVLDMPVEGILNKKEAQTEGWLVHALDLSHLREIRNESRVFNFKDNQRFYTDFPEEEVRLVKKQV